MNDTLSDDKGGADQVKYNQKNENEVLGSPTGARRYRGKTTRHLKCYMCLGLIHIPGKDIELPYLQTIRTLGTGDKSEERLAENASRVNICNHLGKGMEKHATLYEVASLDDFIGRSALLLAIRDTKTDYSTKLRTAVYTCLLYTLLNQEALRHIPFGTGERAVIVAIGIWEKQAGTCRNAVYKFLTEPKKRKGTTEKLSKDDSEAVSKLLDKAVPLAECYLRRLCRRVGEMEMWEGEGVREALSNACCSTFKPIFQTLKDNCDPQKNLLSLFVQMLSWRLYFYSNGSFSKDQSTIVDGKHPNEAQPPTRGAGSEIRRGVARCGEDNPSQKVRAPTIGEGSIRTGDETSIKCYICQPVLVDSSFGECFLPNLSKNKVKKQQCKRHCYYSGHAVLYEVAAIDDYNPVPLLTTLQDATLNRQQKEIAGVYTCLLYSLFNRDALRTPPTEKGQHAVAKVIGQWWYLTTSCDSYLNRMLVAQVKKFGPEEDSGRSEVLKLVRQFATNAAGLILVLDRNIAYASYMREQVLATCLKTFASVIPDEKKLQEFSVMLSWRLQFYYEGTFVQLDPDIDTGNLKQNDSPSSLV